MNIAKKAIILLIAGGAVLLGSQEPVQQLAMDGLSHVMFVVHHFLGIS